MRYTLLLNEAGGILDDLMATRRAGGLALWSSMRPARKPISPICASVSAPPWPSSPRFERALLALQGPLAAAVLGPVRPRHRPHSVHERRRGGHRRHRLRIVTRSGYTGEDGFEISCARR